MCFGGGGDQSGAYTQAAQIQAQGTQAGIAAWEAALAKARADVDPWLKSGKEANNLLSGFYGLSGYENQPSALQQLKDWPGLGFILNSGSEALDRSAASKSMTLSGAQQKGLQTYGQNTGLTYALQPYLQGVTGMSNQGLQAGGMSGNWAMQTGQGVAGLQQAGAQAQASGLVNAANANAQNSETSDWMSAIGMLGGLAAAPFTGGTSLIGSGMSALGGLLGNSGGGSGGYASQSGGYLQPTNYNTSIW